MIATLELLGLALLLAALFVGATCAFAYGIYQIHVLISLVTANHRDRKFFKQIERYRDDFE